MQYESTKAYENGLKLLIVIVAKYIHIIVILYLLTLHEFIPIDNLIKCHLFNNFHILSINSQSAPVYTKQCSIHLFLYANYYIY